MKGLLFRSIENRERIEMIYMDKSGQISQRIIRVLKINDEKVMAYCYTKREVRTFKIENILSAGSISKRMGA